MGWDWRSTTGWKELLHKFSLRTSVLLRLCVRSLLLKFPIRRLGALVANALQAVFPAELTEFAERPQRLIRESKFHPSILILVITDRPGASETIGGNS